MNDEIMTELHAIKDAIGEKYNYNLRTLFEDIKQSEAELKASGTQVLAPPLNPASLPKTALQRTRFISR